MMAGRSAWPALARTAKNAAASSAAPAAATIVEPTLATGRTPPRRSRWARTAYPITKKGNPPCQNMYIQAVVCGPAPSSPPGEKRPGKVSRCAKAAPAVNT
jgi:hypothetical protein